MRIWTCKIGEYYGADWPMRKAIQQTYYEVTGKWAKFTFSGWNGELTEGERRAVEYKQEG